MKRWMVYALAVAAVLALRPRENMDVSNLLPVELLYINKEAGFIRVETDTGAVGVGRDLNSALQNLKDTAPGKVFLETADYLIVTEQTKGLLPALVEILRPAAEVCIGINADAQAAVYLKAHPPKTTLNDIRAGGREVPVLIKIKERYQFGESRTFSSQA